MASTSAHRHTGTAGKMKSVGTTISSDSQSFIVEIRRAMAVMKEVAVDLERHNQSQMVKELEDALLQLAAASEDSTHFCTAIQSVGNSYKYEPGKEPTDFKTLIEDAISKSKATSPSNLQNHPLLRQFREAIWSVHHAGQPVPGEEQEDLVMTSTECNLLNIICPLTGKPITEVADPVRSMDCKHIYEKKAIMQQIKSKRTKCPVAGCPKILVAERVVCDPLLLIEIEEMRSLNKESTRTQLIEDFTALDEE
ncbi:hypothetical protein NMG60_11037035 [Bertholletia excelsa]